MDRYKDMKKAYDSISLDSLRLALERIALSAPIVRWIINLFKDQNMRVITAYSLTDSFTAQDGIDQGDAISPLLWRIFYDPLLETIQTSKLNAGYNLEVVWPSDVNTPTEWPTYTCAVPIMCYMDDTVYIDSSKDRIQASIDIGKEFFYLHDIHINRKKCELISVNNSLPKPDRFVVIGQEDYHVHTIDDEIRYLGVWFAAKRNTSKWKACI